MFLNLLYFCKIVARRSEFVLFGLKTHSFINKVQSILGQFALYSFLLCMPGKSVYYVDLKMRENNFIICSKIFIFVFKIYFVYKIK